MNIQQNDSDDNTLGSQNWPALQGHAVGLKLNHTLEEARYNQIIERLILFLAFQGLDVVHVVVSHAPDGAVCLEAQGPLTEREMRDLVLKFNGMVFHSEVLLCTLPYQHRHQVEWLDPCTRVLSFHSFPWADDPNW